MPLLKETIGYNIIKELLAAEGRKPFRFQEETWQHILNGESGLVNAPTGCGKTFSVFLGAIIDFINQHPDDYKKLKNRGIQLLWITPLRALANDIARAMEEVIQELDLKWKIGIRNGDTSTAERARQKQQMPEVLIITPESLHLLIAQKGYAQFFSSLKIIAVDEWHELIGNKRGVQVELAIARIVNSPESIVDSDSPLSVWGISATIGNLGEASDVLLSPLKLKGVMVKAEMKKQIEVESVFPDEIEKYPWAGHLGIKLVHKILPIIHESRTTLIFINTRGMSEIWYQQILNASPDLAGAIALHHGSVERELREWVEENLHTGKLKAVVCTASLDLGVDFRPVETVIQVGSPKGVARFLQRAGRSGHQPGATSRIYFVPTHSLELMEAAALREAIKQKIVEDRLPYIRSFDVLIQYLITLAVSNGFRQAEILSEIRSTFSYSSVTDDEWYWLLNFMTTGGDSLQAYDEYRKVIIENGIYKVD